MRPPHCSYWNGTNWQPGDIHDTERSRFPIPELASDPLGCRTGSQTKSANVRGETRLSANEFLKLPSQYPALKLVCSLPKHLAVLEIPQGQAQLGALVRGATGALKPSDQLSPSFREQLSSPKSPAARPPPPPPEPCKASRPRSPPDRLSAVPVRWMPLAGLRYAEYKSLGRRTLAS